VGVDNAASLALASKLGFTRIGEQMDERDGLEIVFELVRPSTEPPVGLASP
jgi:RimJ/RimL family protein N-acetyltransferase